jgi:hypothetical protein
MKGNPEEKSAGFQVFGGKISFFFDSRLEKRFFQCILTYRLQKAGK